MIKSIAELRERMARGQIAQAIEPSRIIITATNERVSRTAVNACVKRGFAEAISTDLFGDVLGAWRAPADRS